VADPSIESDDALLDRFQRAAFDYFLEQGNPDNGLVADTSRQGSPASIAVTGFALSCYPVGVERGWMTRANAASAKHASRLCGSSTAARRASSWMRLAIKASITTFST
jgi:hypothetical protein